VLDAKNYAELIDNIMHADQLMQLRSLREQFQRSIQITEQSQVENSVAQLNIYINDVHDAMIAKTIAIAERSMTGEGLGPPPVSYCYMLLGSAGRKEQTLASDQDSAIFYADHEAADEVKQYFLAFSHRIVSMLIELGYPPCEGKVQSDERLWCQSEREWSAQLDHWFKDASWESVRYLLIVADGRCIAGDSLLFARLRKLYEQRLLQHPHILKRMIDNTLHHKVLLGVLGHFITDRYGASAGCIDVKYGSYIPMVNSIRWLALQANIWNTSTLSRLEQLQQQSIISQSDYYTYRDAFLQMLSLRLVAGYRIENGLYEGNSKLHPKRLERSERKKLKQNLKLGKKIQKLVLLKFARLK